MISCCSPTLYIGESKHGFYALPAFADESTVSIAVSSGWRLSDDSMGLFQFLMSTFSLNPHKERIFFYANFFILQQRSLHPGSGCWYKAQWHISVWNLSLMQFKHQIANIVVRMSKNVNFLLMWREEVIFRYLARIVWQSNDEGSTA